MCKSWFWEGEINGSNLIWPGFLNTPSLHTNRVNTAIHETLCDLLNDRPGIDQPFDGLPAHSS
ncbi:MAG: hypothetical protein ACOYMP_13160 [Nodosilinea sp.]